MYARVMAQFVLKIEKLSHIMGPTPILEMARAYGLRPRLWLLQRHMNSKHSDSNFAPVIPMYQEKCQRFQLVHPFTCMVAGMTGSAKTVWVQSPLQQAQTVNDQMDEPFEPLDTSLEPSV